MEIICPLAHFDIYYDKSVLRIVPCCIYTSLCYLLYTIKQKASFKTFNVDSAALLNVIHLSWANNQIMHFLKGLEKLVF